MLVDTHLQNIRPTSQSTMHDSAVPIGTTVVPIVSLVMQVVVPTLSMSDSDPIHRKRLVRVVRL